MCLSTVSVVVAYSLFVCVLVVFEEFFGLLEAFCGWGVEPLLAAAFSEV